MTVLSASDPYEAAVPTANGTNVFLLALKEEQRHALTTVTNAWSLAFHGLLDPAVALEPKDVTFVQLAELARAELAAFDGSVDAILTHWDFPSSALMPLLCHERGLPAAPLKAVLTCEHKYWSRIQQARSVPEAVPAFAGFDPFADEPLDQIDIPFPFWVKPIKAHSSALGFKVENPEEFARAVERIRQGIGRLGALFDEVLAMVDLPEELQGYGGSSCIAEELVTGRQIAPEGSMQGGEFNIHGVFDMPKDARGLQYSRLEYPARISDELRQRMSDISERYLRHIGYDDGCFNVEFMYDEDTDQLRILEVNTRISQSHSELFVLVDGMSNHEVALDVALGVRPMLPDRRGDHEVAAKCLLHIDDVADGIVRAVPSEHDIAELRRRFPGLTVELGVAPGDRLSDLGGQSAYRYDVGSFFVGASSWDELDERHDTCVEHLRFDIEPID